MYDSSVVRAVVLGILFPPRMRGGHAHTLIELLSFGHRPDQHFHRFHLLILEKYELMNSS